MDIRKLLSHGLSSALVMNLPINESFSQLTQTSQKKQKRTDNSLMGMKASRIFETPARPGIRDM